MNNRIKIFLFFNVYTLVYNILFMLMELFPAFIRTLFFRLILKKMGKNSIIDFKTYMRFPSKISIGNNVNINRNCKLIAGIQSEEARIVFKDNIAIGPNVTFFAAGHDHQYLSLPDIGSGITVKNYCWIGGNSIILPGVTLEEGVIIGAGSIVTKSIPAYSVAVGNPAKVIKKREILQEKHL